MLEQSFLGMPASSRGIAAWAVLLVAASVAAAPIWATRAVPRLLAWLAAGSHPGGGGSTGGKAGSPVRKLRAA